MVSCLSAAHVGMTSLGVVSLLLFYQREKTYTVQSQWQQWLLTCAAVTYQPPPLHSVKPYKLTLVRNS